MDTVVLVNEKDEVTGTMPRVESHQNGAPNRIVVIYVENTEGEILVQVRMTGRLDHSSAGHVDPGEVYIEAARRELKEELGIDAIEIRLIGHGISEEKIPDMNEHRVHVMAIFLCIGKPGKLQEDEVRDVYWADPEEVLKEMKERSNDMKFSEGFRVSLPIYLATKS